MFSTTFSRETEPDSSASHQECNNYISEESLQSVTVTKLLFNVLVFSASCRTVKRTQNILLTIINHILGLFLLCIYLWEKITCYVSKHLWTSGSPGFQPVRKLQVLLIGRLFLSQNTTHSPSSQCQHYFNNNLKYLYITDTALTLKYIEM